MTEEPRLTVAALRYYVPLFQEGVEAENTLLEGVNLPPGEVHRLESIINRNELIVERITELSAPLMAREIHKMVSKSHLRGRDDVFDVLFYAGVGGIRRGLRKFSVDKLAGSPTNYLFQWFSSYTKKELLGLEAPFGIPPSRFEQYKKVSAVRKKLTEANGRYADNDEVYEFLQSGKADLETFNGRKVDRGKRSGANLSITPELIAEQERFEKELLTVALIDTTAEYESTMMTIRDPRPFEETAFGVFAGTRNFTSEAIAVLKSDLGEGTNEDDEIVLSSMDKREYTRLSRKWKMLISDPEGSFRFFLEDAELEFPEFDREATLAGIIRKGGMGQRYEELFVGGVEEVHD